MRLVGEGGSLRVGYQTAAILGRWTLEGTAPEWTLTADVADVNPFWWTARPFDLVLRHGDRRWIWRSITLASETPLTLQLIGEPTIQ